MGLRQHPGPLAILGLILATLLSAGCSLSSGAAGSSLASQQPTPPGYSSGSNHSADPSPTVPRQAESEFDAALEAHLDTSLKGQASTRLLETDELPAHPSSAWLLSLASPPRSLVPEPQSPPDPDEATQEAPALLGPQDIQELNEDQVEASTALPEPDSAKHDIPIVFNDKVKTLIYHFQTRKWDVITRAFERASRHLPTMRRIFLEKGLPEDLLNLAFIESAVNPRATSRAKAAGIWQFMPSTGRRYGMQYSFWLDERRDPEKSTRGAAEYLKQLYEMFGDWPLALAAYNAGEGKVQAAIKRQRTRDYWRLRLPRETRYFVPAFMAMTIIAREPERYGFSPPPEASPEVDVVSLDHPTDLKIIAEASASSLEEIQELNPELIRWATPTGMPQYALRIPAGRRDDFLGALEQIPPEERITWIRHTIRKGETPTSIARRYGVDLRSVLDLNGLRKRHAALKPGGTLLIPPMPARSVGAGAEPPRQVRTVARVTPPGRYAAKREERPQSNRRSAPGKRYVVKRGDTLWDIAQDHAVPLEEIRRVNKLSRDATLRPGQRLTIPHPPS